VLMVLLAVFLGCARVVLAGELSAPPSGVVARTVG
jgi:hypothetical protein